MVSVSLKLTKVVLAWLAHVHTDEYIEFNVHTEYIVVARTGP